MSLRRFARSCRHELKQLCQPNHLSVESEHVRGAVYTVASTPVGRVFSVELLGRNPVQIVSEAHLAEDSNYALVTNLRASLCHQRAAFTFDSSGHERFELQVIDVKPKLAKCVFSMTGVANLAWCTSPSKPNFAIITVQAPDGRANRFELLQLDSARTKTILEESDGGLFLDVAATKDHTWITLNSNSRNDSQVLLLRPSVDGYAAQVEKWQHELLLRLPAREPGVQYFVEHAHGHLLAITNKTADLSYSVLCHPSPPVDTPPDSSSARSLADWDNWRLLIPPQADFKLEDVDVFERGAMLYGRDTRSGLPSLRFAAWRVDAFGDLQADVATVHTPPEVACVEPGGNQDYQRSTATVHVGWSTAPGSSVELPLQAGSSLEAHPAEQELRLPSSWPAAQLAASADYGSFMACEHITARSRDGSVEVPITLVGRPEALHCQQSLTPLLVNVYGAYGTPLDTAFDPSDMPWLLRGWVTAFVHARGGGERGQPWYHGGRQLAKLNTMHDLEDAIGHLHASGLSRPELTVVSGSSAGGLPAAWMCHADAPQGAPSPPSASIAATILSMPFLDVIRSMSDPSLPLTVPEYTEWGDPVADAPPGTLALMQQYCPQYLARQRLAAGVPAMTRPVHTYVIGAVNDPRTPVWQQRNYVKALKRSTKHAPSAFHQPVQARVWWPHDAGSNRKHASSSGRGRFAGAVLDLLGKGDAGGRVVTTEPPQEHGVHLQVHMGSAGHHGAGGWDSAADDVSKQLLFAHRAVGLPCV